MNFCEFRSFFAIANQGPKTSLIYFLLGLQHDVIHPENPYGLPLDFDLLPQKLKQAGRYWKRFMDF